MFLDTCVYPDTQTHKKKTTKYFLNKYIIVKPSKVVCACDPGTSEAEAGRSWVWG